MGQFALGVRSLLVRSTVFVVMAALLAWALGGTLFPKPQRSDLRDAGVQFDGGRWYWRLLVGGKREGEVRWHLMRDDAEGKPVVVAETPYQEVAGPVLGDDAVYYAGRRPGQHDWELCRRTSARETIQDCPDRLAVEQQLARAAAGLPLQDAQTVSRQRPRVLDPLPETADE